MGVVTFQMDAEEAKSVRAMQRFIDKQVQAERGSKRLSQGGKEAQSSFQRFGQAAGSELKGMVRNIASVTAAVALIKKGWTEVLAEIRKVNEAQRERAGTGGVFNLAALAVANQMGMGATEEGQRIGADYLTQVLRAGRFGADYAKGEAAAVAGHVAFGEPGKMVGARGQAAVGTIAEFIGFKQIEEGEVGGLFKTLAQAGVKTRDDAALRLRQLWGTYEEALTTDPSAALGGITKFVGEYVKQKGTFELGLARFGEAVAGTGSAQDAAMRSRQMVQIMRNEKMQGILAKRMGIGLEEFRGMEDMDIRMQAFGEFAAQATEAELVRAGVEKRQIGWVTGLYGGGGYQNIMDRKRRMRGMTAGQMYGELRGFGGTQQAMEMDAATEAGIIEGVVSRDVTMGKAQMLKYTALWRRAIDKEVEIPGFGERQKYLLSNEKEQQYVALLMMAERARGLKGRGLEGMEAGELFAELQGEMQREAGPMALALGGMGPVGMAVGGMGQVTFEEVGRMERMLKALERMVSLMEGRGGLGPGVPQSPFNMPD